MISILIFIISLFAIATIAAGGTLGFEGMMLSWIAVWLLSIPIIRRIRNSQPEISAESQGTHPITPNRNGPHTIGRKKR